ncbi:MAG: hypothetical protein ACHQVS_01155 [Candidatus Babeliales bacterium]
MKKKIMVLISMFMMVQVCFADQVSTPREETFAGFPGEPTESFYYVRTYPYTTLLIITAAVSGILYYHRSNFRKRIRQLLYLTEENTTTDTVTT